VADEETTAVADEPAWQQSLANDRPRGFPWPPMILIGVVVLASVIAVGVRSIGGRDDGPKVLTDAAFVAAANQACREAFPPLRPAVTGREDVIGAKEVAAQSRRAADGLEALAVRLEALPVSGPDRPFVAKWLDDWRTFVDTGRQYANVLETGNVRAANKIATSGDPAQARADGFARANRVKDCQLRAVFVAPPRQSPI
jgi:hypothetical protein